MMREGLRASDVAKLDVAMKHAEGILRGGRFKLELFHNHKRWDNVVVPDRDPFDVIEMSNIYVNAGGALLLDLLIGAGGTVFSNANANIGVGNGTTAPAAGQTDLQGASKDRNPMDATFPSRSGQVMTFRATYATGDANFAWEEIGLFNAASAGTMLCRSLISSPFTKTSAISVVATYTLTVP